MNRTLTHRIPIALSLAALVVACLGSASLVSAAKRGKPHRGPRGAQGQTGPVGPTGPAGQRGPTGPPGVMATPEYVSQRLPVAPGADRPVTERALCPAGKRAVGGGLSGDPGQPLVHVVETAPFDGGRGWVASAVNPGAAGTVVFVWAVCV